MTTAAILIIGDEILSGKVAERNTEPLIAQLRDDGVQLGFIGILRDEDEAIMREVRRCADAFDAVVTSGGIGPTHDDRTIPAVARALGVPVVRHPELERMVRSFWGDRVSDAALRLADVPAGSRLLDGGDGLLPVVVARNVYLLPGVPRLFAAKIGSLRTELTGRRPALASVYLRCDESRVAATLERLVAEHPGVTIGSYPQTDAVDHTLWITLESLDSVAVAAATDRLVALLPATDVVRIETRTP